MPVALCSEPFDPWAVVERYGLSEPHGYAKADALLRQVEIGFVLPY